MKNLRLKHVWIMVIGILLVYPSYGQSEDQRIRPYDENPSYWQYEGKPVMLLGGTKDDNAFQLPDLKEHLQLLSKVGGNYIRNTMSDRQDKGFELYPFKKLDNGKYDLDQWNKEYWQRFENMLRWTSEMDIVVQIEVWDRFDYSRNNWIPHPYNPKNNVNYTYEESGFKEEYPRHPGSNEQPFFFTTPKQQNNKTVLPFQQKFVNKILDYSLDYPNVLYCMDNETSGEEAWAVYWAEFISKRGEKENKPVNVTEMWDDWDLRADRHRRTFDHPERFDFVDVSQNNHQRNQTHWDNFQWVHNYLSSQPRPINNVKIYGADGGAHGGGHKDAVEKFWRLIVGGAASARFHRPTSGIGLSELAQTQIRSARMLLQEFSIFEATPDSKSELLSNREENEAYLTRIEDQKYVVYFTNGGEVQLDLSNPQGEYSLRWLNISESKWLEATTVTGGEKVELKPPVEGQSVALLVKK